MITEYELYSDERKTRIPGVRYLLLGGVICTDRGRQRLLANLQGVREKHGVGREMKWGRVSSRYLDAYQAYLRAFFGDPYARFSILLVNQSGEAWNSFVPRRGRAVRTDDRLASVFYQFLLVTFGALRDTKRWTVFHDSGFFSRDRVLTNVEFLFNRTYKRAFGPKASRIIRFVNSLDSKATELIQLTDLLLGAASYDILDASVHSLGRQAMLQSYQAMVAETPQTSKGLPKVQVVEWTRPDEFDYEATRRPNARRR